MRTLFASASTIAEAASERVALLRATSSIQRSGETNDASGGPSRSVRDIAAARMYPVTKTFQEILIGIHITFCLFHDISPVYDDQLLQALMTV